jgi:hypothetical protein
LAHLRQLIAGASNCVSSPGLELASLANDPSTHHLKRDRALKAIALTVREAERRRQAQKHRDYHSAHLVSSRPNQRTIRTGQ